MSKNEYIDILFPGTAVGVFWCTYVDGVGFSIRAIGIPGTDPDAYVRELTLNGLVCEHTIPCVWIFQGYWTKRKKVFSYVTSDVHQASEIISDPTRIRFLGEQMVAPLLPLDPVTGSAALSVKEYNDWIHVATGEGDHRLHDDWAMAQEVDLGPLEDFLQAEAEKDKE